MNFYRKLVLVFLFFYLSLFFIFYAYEGQPDHIVDSAKLLHPYSLIQTHYYQIVNESSSPNHCNVRNYPFSEEEYQRIFTFREYGPCPTYDDIHSTHKNRVYSVRCKNPKDALYSSDLKRNSAYGGGQKLNVFWRKIKDSHSTSEFSFIKCSKKSVHAMVFNRYKAENAEKANKIRVKLNSDTKNMNVLLLVFDSVSKYTYERYLTKTLRFLNDLETNPKFMDTYSYHEFEKSATPHHYTIYNMAQILFGVKVEDLMSEVKLDRSGNPIIPRSQKDNQKMAIWSHYQKLGYTTMFLHDSVWDYIPMITGRVIETDHSFVDFWKYAWGVYDWHDFSDKQRCAGSRNSHDLSFDYTYQYFYNYRENHKFAYVHLDAAHESSGNIQTVDDDLVVFLEDLLLLFQSRNENFALFLISDHGNKHMGKIRWDIRGFFEAHVPMTHLILSKEVEHKWKAREKLKINRKRLLSRMDLNLSLKHIAYFPYDIPVNTNEIGNYEFEGITSIFENEVNENRTCADVGVKKEHCLCSWFQDVDFQDEREVLVKGHFEELMREFFENNADIVLECDPMENFSLVIMKSFQLKEEETSMNTLYFFEYELPGIKLTAMGNFCLKRENWKFNKAIDQKMYPFSTFFIPEGEAFLQISDIKIHQECIKNICKCKEEIKSSKSGHNKKSMIST